jgi:nitroreductase
MGVWEAIDSLRVVRNFDTRPLPEGEIKKIVNAGRRAGSSKNLQRWGFVVVGDRKRLQRLSAAGLGRATSQARLVRSPS